MVSSIERPAWITDNLEAYKNRYLRDKVLRNYKWNESIKYRNPQN